MVQFVVIGVCLFIMIGCEVYGYISSKREDARRNKNND